MTTRRGKWQEPYSAAAMTPKTPTILTKIAGAYAELHGVSVDDVDVSTTNTTLRGPSVYICVARVRCYPAELLGQGASHASARWEAEECLDARLKAKRSGLKEARQ